MRSALTLAVLLAACSAGVPEAPVRDYLVQYPQPVDGADSLVIKEFDASIELAIPVAKSLVIRSSRALSALRTIPDITNLDPIDSLTQVISAIVFFNTAPADYTLSAVNALASGPRRSIPADSGSLWIENRFRITAINDIATIYNVREVDLDFPPPNQTLAERPQP
ncbi:MAG: hypothetical protein ACREL5_13580 [Gemmatimonadales bacterium]